MNANEKEKNVEKFSEKSLLSLGDYYVYGLIDPRNRKIFYIKSDWGYNFIILVSKYIRNIAITY